MMTERYMYKSILTLVLNYYQDLQEYGIFTLEHYIMYIIVIIVV